MSIIVEESPTPSVVAQETGSNTVQVESADAVTINVTESEAPVLTVEESTSVTIAGEGVLTWIDYVTGFSSDPTLLQTITEGEVYEYTYPNGTLYRLIPYDSAVDSFYRNFSSGVLSGLVAQKQITI